MRFMMLLFLKLEFFASEGGAWGFETHVVLFQECQHLDLVQLEGLSTMNLQVTSRPTADDGRSKRHSMCCSALDESLPLLGKPSSPNSYSHACPFHTLVCDPNYRI